MKTAFLFCFCVAVSAASAGTRVGIGINIGVPAPVIVHRAPPPPIVETVAVTPGPGYVWVPGHYTWAGRWIWMTGAWVLPPQPGAVWINGHWNRRTHQWIEAHWEVRAVAAPTEIVVGQPPPAPVAEVQVQAPGPDFVWISGYWGWETGRHVWIAGHWERPPHPRQVWVAPRWERRGQSYVFVRGFWR